MNHSKTRCPLKTENNASISAVVRCSSNPTAGYTSKGNRQRRGICTPEFTIALWTGLRQSHPRCPSPCEWTGTGVHKHPEILLCLEKNEILTPGLNNIMLSEISQTQERKCHVVPFICKTKKLVSQKSKGEPESLVTGTGRQRGKESLWTHSKRTCLSCSSVQPVAVGYSNPPCCVSE